MIYFISDMHLNHRNIIRYCNRPFDSIEEMNKTLIDNWNATVTDDDIVYNLGDLTLGNPPVVTSIMKQLHGKTRLIYGNHDYWMKSKKARDYFLSIDREKVLTFKYNGKELRLLLTHFPRKLEEVDADFIIYGHIHNNEHDPYWEYQRTHPRVLNACVDVNDFKPVTLEQLIENNKKIKL